MLPQDQKAIAVIGSRNFTLQGKQMCELFVKEFVKNGFTIVSGLARGIDAIAHQTTLNYSGRTIAVLGCGIDIVYPPENIKLFQQISARGAILSEFPPGTKPYPKNFLGRNRIVSGLSLAVLIIEAARRSGTLSTAAHAARQGREVFVLPFGDGAKYLISQGATVPENPKQIIGYLKNFI